jgi:hypothetical protein
MRNVPIGPAGPITANPKRPRHDRLAKTIVDNCHVAGDVLYYVALPFVFIDDGLSPGVADDRSLIVILALQYECANPALRLFGFCREWPHTEPVRRVMNARRFIANPPMLSTRA